MRYRTKEETAALKERVIALSCLLMTNKQIAERVGCHDAQVSAILKERGFTPMLRRGETSGPPVARGAFSHVWGGGRFKKTEGYIMAYCPGHPRADRNGHVLEHILVAELKEKRHIAIGEIVHHVNGKRDDNRPENLEVLPDMAAHMKLHAKLRRKKKKAA